MDNDLLRHVAQITIAYLQRNSVASSDLPKLIEYIGRAMLKLHSKEQMPRPPNWIADRLAQSAGNFVTGFESRPKSKPRDGVVHSPGEYRGKRTSRPGARNLSPTDAALQLTMAQHIGLVQRLLSDQERLGFSRGSSD